MACESDVSAYYAYKNIFITGATGFMGKVLVEKLLRDCEELSKIYILVRTKKGQQPHERYENYINHIVFERIRTNNPDRLKKIKIIRGDVTIDDLGLDASDETELIENVHLVFHMAANVRFDLTLKEATNFNINGTYRVLKLATKMKHLEVFTHVSTTYCHCDQEVLDECYYKSRENPYGLMEMTKVLSDEMLDLITPKILGGTPNTYSYTKGLTEELVHSFHDRLPIVIVRPSIVVASYKEPMPGYVEGVNGPTGLMIAAAKGVVRSMLGNPDNPCESIPVDFNINCIIALAYKKSLMEKKNEVFYCNITDSGMHTITWGQALDYGREVFDEYPMLVSLWYPNGSMKKNRFFHMLCVIFFHYLPAYVIDFLLFITGNKPFLVNIQKRISHGLKVLQYYTSRKWIFRNNNLKSLYSELNEVDKKKFNFNFVEVNFRDYIKNYILGIRKYILKENPEDLQKARNNLRRLYYLDLIVKIIFGCLIGYYLLNHIGEIFGFFEKVGHIFFKATQSHNETDTKCEC